MKEKTKEPDLIEKIANSLPFETRADYLNEMRHLRSLPENDEMLRILHVMQFLTLMTEQVPSRILTEREKLETACQEIIFTAHRLEKTGGEYYRQLDQRLIELPVDIAAKLNPAEIVALINSLLKRQFEATTIPTIANELAANIDTIKTATKEYARESKELSASWRSTSNEAYKTIEKIKEAAYGAVNATQKAAVDFSNIFQETCNKAFWILITIGLVTVIMIGMTIFGYIQPHTKTVYELPHDVLLMLEQQAERKLMLTPKEP